MSAYVHAAEGMGLPFVPPFLTHNGSFRQGANFAVAGAFARNSSFYSDLPVVGPFALNTSSSVQLQWFDSLKPSLCNPAQGTQTSFIFAPFFLFHPMHETNNNIERITLTDHGLCFQSASASSTGHSFSWESSGSTITASLFSE
jgi:hypothetical protein